MQDVHPHHLSSLALDLLLLGDLGDEPARDAKRHIEACPSCRERYEELQLSYETFERQVHPRTAADVTRRAGTTVAATPFLGAHPRRSRWRTATLAALAGAAALLLLLARPFGRREPSLAEDTALLVKGAPSFDIFARRASRVFLVQDGAQLEPGDAVRFMASAGGASFLLVASIDAAGRATIYFPYLGQESAAISPGRHFTDSSSIVLDETRGPERIFALFSSKPIAAEVVSRALAAIGRGGVESIRGAPRVDVPADFQTSVLIEK